MDERLARGRGSIGQRFVLRAVALAATLSIGAYLVVAAQRGAHPAEAGPIPTEPSDPGPEVGAGGATDVGGGAAVAVPADEATFEEAFLWSSKSGVIDASKLVAADPPPAFLHSSKSLRLDPSATTSGPGGTHDAKSAERPVYLPSSKFSTILPVPAMPPEPPAKAPAVDPSAPAKPAPKAPAKSSGSTTVPSKP